jgi:hypothetical protein
MTREEFAARLGEGIVKVTAPDMIRAAWGNRRVSSRNRGLQIEAYPREVWASRGCWLAWFDNVQANPDRVFTVIAKKKAQARIDAAMGRVSVDPEMAETVPLEAISGEEIEDMLAEREELRAARQFADADRIRDYLVAQGVVVQDRKVSA